MALSMAGALRAPGEITGMVVDVTKLAFTKPFQWREFLEQAWFITSVTLMPTIWCRSPSAQ